MKLGVSSSKQKKNSVCSYSCHLVMQTLDCKVNGVQLPLLFR